MYDVSEDLSTVFQKDVRQWCLHPSLHTATIVKCQLRAPRGGPGLEVLWALCTEVKAASALWGQSLKENRWVMGTRHKREPGEHTERHPSMWAAHESIPSSKHIIVFPVLASWGPHSGSDYAGQTRWHRATGPVLTFLCKRPGHRAEPRNSELTKTVLKGDV